jgi:hypothetical protein
VNITKTQNVYPYIYKCRSKVPSKCLHTHRIHHIQNPQASEAPRYKNGVMTPTWAHQPIYKKQKIHKATLTVPLEHHLLALPQAVVPHLLSVPPDLEVTAQSSQHLPLLPAEPWSARSVEPPHTAPGHPRPGCATTCHQALPIAPLPSGGEYPQNLPRPRPEEPVMVLHLDRQRSIS